MTASSFFNNILIFSYPFFLDSQIESLKHSHKLETANVKLECTRSKGEVEREKDALQGQLDGNNPAQ